MTVKDVTALLLSLSLDKWVESMTQAELTLPTLCETLATAGRTGVADVLKEAGMNAMGPRIRLANTLFELPAGAIVGIIAAAIAFMLICVFLSPACVALC